MKELEFYLCTHCKNLVEMVHFGGAPLMCCGEKMKKLSEIGRASCRERV